MTDSMVIGTGSRIKKGKPMKRQISNSCVQTLSQLSLHLVLALAMVLGLGVKAQASVWQTTQSWNDSWEGKYRVWVNANLDKNFFTRPGFWKDLPMDCADAVYSVRLIFAAQNGLPFVISDSTGGKGVISNEMSRWDSQAEPQRLRSFLEYIHEVTSTSTLPNDTYPVAISRQAIGSGTMIITDAKSHHSWTLRYLSETGIPFLEFASRPARVVLFERYYYPSMEFTFPNGLDPARHAGFRNFRQPESIGQPVYLVPGYSLEQYQIPYGQWRDTLAHRLAITDETVTQRATRLLQQACKEATERVGFVNQGLQGLAQLGSGCFTSQQFDDFSTPSRDLRLKSSLQDLAAEFASDGGALEPAIHDQLASVLSGDASVQNAEPFCVVKISSNRQMTLGQIYVRSVGDKLSSNPHDPLESRWGLAPFPSAKAKACPTY
jgi:hypothetical protein